MSYQDEPKGSGAGQGFGVAGFVLGLIALILSFIPCLGMYALLPGVIALIFSAIAFSQASRANASKGLIIAALIISLTGTLIASWQLVTIRQAREGAEIHHDTTDHDTIKADRDEMIKKLEKLEGEKTTEEEKNREEERNLDEDKSEE